MSTSTDAILFYGFLIDEEKDPYEHEMLTEPASGDLDEIWATKFKLYDEGSSGEDYSFEKISSHQAKYPVEIVMHCSSDSPMYAVAIKNTKTEANRGYARIINICAPDALNEPCYDSQLQQFCVDFGLRVREASEMNWYLVSYWG